MELRSVRLIPLLGLLVLMLPVPVGAAPAPASTADADAAPAPAPNPRAAPARVPAAPGTPGWHDPYPPRVGPPAARPAPNPGARPVAPATPSRPAARAAVPAHPRQGARVMRPAGGAVPELPPAVPELPPAATTAPATLHRQHAPAPAPRRWRLRLVTRSVSLLVRQPSFDVLKSNDLMQRGEVGAGAELRLWQGLVLGGEVGYAGGRFSDTVLQDFHTRLVHDSLLVGAQLGWRLWDGVMPYVRGGLAVTWLEGRVRDASLSLGGRDVAVGGYALGGLEVGLPRAWLRTAGFSLAVHLEAGWVDLGRFHLGGGLDQGQLVDEFRASLGRLRLAGPTVNAGVSLSF